MLRGVTVIGDFLRPDGKGRPGGVDRPIAWLFDAIKRQIALAAGVPVDLLTTTSCPDLAAWVASLRPPEQADPFWAAWFDAVPEADRGPGGNGCERLLRDRLRGRFCVGYELPPYLERLLERWAIPFIDLRLHPIRFMDDLLFAARASERATRAALSTLAVPHAEVLITAGLREAMCRMITNAAVPPDTLLVLGQRPFDATQIYDGRFFDAMAHLPAITAICARHRGVLIKPHPDERHHSLLVAVAGAAPNVLGAIEDNVYRVLAMPEVTAVLTVSSSVAYEAPYFGKTVHALAPLRLSLGWRDDVLDATMHASLDDRVLAPDFWRLVLAPHTPVTRTDGVRLPAKPNRLRIALDCFWRFNEIDTDRIPPRAP